MRIILALLTAWLWAFCTPAGAAQYESWTQITNEMQEILVNSGRIYETGDERAAINEVNVAYFGYYEKLGVERNVKTYISGRSASDVEYQFALLKKRMAARAPLSEVNDLIAELNSSLKAQGLALDGKNEDEGEAEGSGGTLSSSFITVMIASLFIILREGIEAMIVFAAILAYLVKMGHADKQKSVVRGGIYAIVASFAMAYILNLLTEGNGQNQEITEGAVMLVAVVVLFYVSNFMMSKADAAAWMGYLQGKINANLSRGSLFALSFTAFLAVFREGAEVILFYQALLMSAQDSLPVWTGFALGCVLLIFVYIFIRVLSLKLPLKTFFVGTSILMYIICIDFVGAAIKEFQEGDLVSVTPVPYVPTIDILGIYPTVETLVPQLCMLVLCLITMVMAVRKWAQARAELAQKLNTQTNQ